MRFCEQNDGQPVFGTDRVTKKGYCKSHQYLRSDLDKRSIVQKAMSKEKSKRIASKLRQLPENIEGVESVIELNNFFNLAAKELAANPACQECSEFIPKNIMTLKKGKWVEVDNYRNCTAHIILKSIFKSVAANPNNRLFLCCKNGCHDKTHRLDTFSEMKIFPEAVRKFRLFEDQIAESHKLLDTFKEYANEY